jgi:hypothetical protein
MYWRKVYVKVLSKGRCTSERGRGCDEGGGIRVGIVFWIGLFFMYLFTKRVIFIC